MSPLQSPTSRNRRGRRVLKAAPPILAIFLWLAALPLTAATAPSRIDAPGFGDRAAGEELAAELRALRPPGDSRWRGVIKLTRRGKLVASMPLFCQTRINEGGWRVTYSTPGNQDRPAGELTIICHTNKPNDYFLAKAEAVGGKIQEAKQLQRDEIWAPFAGTDFLVADLGLDFLHWGLYRHLNPGRNEMRRTRPCDVLESVNPQSVDQGYSKVLAWFDSEHRGLITAEAFGRDGRQVKEFNLGRIAKVDGAYQLRDMEMLGLKTGSRTKIEFDDESK